jgi:hypothetical protein
VLVQREICAGAALEPVIAFPAAEDIRPSQAVEHVVSSLTEQDVVVGVARERVGERRSRDPLDPGELVRTPADGLARGEARLDGGRRRVERDEVDAAVGGLGPAVDHVVARVPADDVLAGAPADPVVPVPAADQVIAAAAPAALAITGSRNSVPTARSCAALRAIAHLLPCDCRSYTAWPRKASSRST